MATWKEEKQSEQLENSNNYEDLPMTHDLQDCIDESLDICFNNVYEQLPVINYSKYSEEQEKPENSTYIGKLGHDESTG